jgi:hypothetical protein
MREFPGQNRDTGIDKNAIKKAQTLRLSGDAGCNLARLSKEKSLSDSIT